MVGNQACWVHFLSAADAGDCSGTPDGAAGLGALRGQRVSARYADRASRMSTAKGVPACPWAWSRASRACDKRTVERGLGGMVDRSSPGSGLPAVGALTKHLRHQGFESGIDLDLLAVKL